jgi:hypothetical protein
MFKLTRAFVVAAVLSSSVLCAPIPKDTGKPISTNVSVAYILAYYFEITKSGICLQQSADPSAHASRVFGTTSQDPNYQTHPTTLCIVPAMAKDAGLSQGQEELTVKQAIELCQEANTIAVSQVVRMKSNILTIFGIGVVEEPQAQPTSSRSQCSSTFSCT